MSGPSSQDSVESTGTRCEELSEEALGGLQAIIKERVKRNRLEFYVLMADDSCSWTQGSSVKALPNWGALEHSYVQRQKVNALAYASETRAASRRASRERGKAPKEYAAFRDTPAGKKLAKAKWGPKCGSDGLQILDCPATELLCSGEEEAQAYTLALGKRCGREEAALLDAKQRRLGKTGCSLTRCSADFLAGKVPYNSSGNPAKKASSKAVAARIRAQTRVAVYERFKLPSVSARPPPPPAPRTLSKHRIATVPQLPGPKAKRGPKKSKSTYYKFVPGGRGLFGGTKPDTGEVKKMVPVHMLAIGNVNTPPPAQPPPLPPPTCFLHAIVRLTA